MLITLTLALEGKNIFQAHHACPKAQSHGIYLLCCSSAITLIGPLLFSQWSHRCLEILLLNLTTLSLHYRVHMASSIDYHWVVASCYAQHSLLILLPSAYLRSDISQVLSTYNIKRKTPNAAPLPTSVYEAASRITA